MSTTPPQIDPRGPRFTAGITLLVFAAVLLTAPSTTALVLLSIQTLFFAIGAGRGVQHTPTSFVFRTLVRPRLAAPTHTEDARPPRFAQTVGLVFAVVALSAFATGLDTLGLVFSAFALAAALLNSVFGFCLGCELYLIGQRVRNRGTSTTHDSTINEATKEEVTA
ncbi:MAG: DUF4395 domain-containing protein [Propionibacteriales bacterium]|nr:DUF4395 domain-containing protein [Propionibacteriales bacterium]